MLQELRVRRAVFYGSHLNEVEFLEPEPPALETVSPLQSSIEVEGVDDSLTRLATRAARKGAEA